MTTKPTLMSQQYYLPAEWERQDGVQLTWPHAGTDWRPYLAEITETYVQLSAAIAARERLVIAAEHPLEVASLLATRLTDGEMRRVKILPCPCDDTWARDHGAITLAERGGGGRRLLDFKFNGWGDKFPSAKDNAITRTLYALGAFNGQMEDCGDFVLEGGSIESDGKGTVMTTSHCLLAPHRNQPMTKGDIERELLRRLCAERIIWIDHGRLIGDDTDGHIDTTVRLAPGDTLLYTGCDDEADEQYGDFLELEQQLQTLTTPDGRPYRLVRLPMPHAIFDDGDRLPATYANFLIINGAVIVPTYRQPEPDRKAMAAIASAFPQREVIGIDATTIVRQHGSIHCLTMQFPQGTLRQDNDKTTI